MKLSKYTNIAVFIIFFGIALVEALQNGEWVLAGLFLALGVISIWGDVRKSNNRQ